MRSGSRPIAYKLYRPVTDEQTPYSDRTHGYVNSDLMAAPSTHTENVIDMITESQLNYRFQPFFEEQATLVIQYYMRNVRTNTALLPAGTYSFQEAEDKTTYSSDEDDISLSDEDNRISFSIDADLLYFGTVDLRTLTVHNLPVIQCLMQAANINRYFPAGPHILPLRADDQQIMQYYFITLRHDVVIRKDKYGSIVCDLINSDTQEGFGCYGSIYDFLGSFKFRYFDTPGIQLEPGLKRRVVKLVKEKPVSAGSFNYRADWDNAISQKFHALKTRQVFFGSTATERVYGISMRKIGGEDLHLQFMHDARQISFTLADRFELSIKIFQALKTQVHDAGLIHNDIKPDNIHAYKDAAGWHVFILDTGSAEEIALRSQINVFAVKFSPPEVHTHQRDQSSDIFSMGLVAALLWRDKNQRLLNAADNNVIKQRENAQWIISFDAFDQLTDLPAATKNQILSLLTAMTHRDQQSRPDINACIQQWKNIYNDYLADQLSNSDEESNVEACQSFAYQRHDSLLEAYQLNLYSAKKLLHKFIMFIEQYEKDEGQDKKVLQDLRDHTYGFKSFINAREVMKLTQETVGEESQHIQRKIEKMTRELKCFKGLLEANKSTQNSSLRVAPQ